MKKLSFVIMLILLVEIVSAQDTKVPATYKNEFGLHAGGVTGVGLFYRHWFDKTGLQLTVLPPIKNDDYRLNSVGITFLHSFVDKRYMRFFGYIGAHYWHEKGTNELYDYSSGNYFTTTESYVHDFFNFGFGPGVSFGTKVRVSLLIGYGLYDVAGDFNALPTGEFSLAYCF
jgi:hypothetical protein